MGYTIVKSIPLLKKMEKAGLIVLHNQTGTKIKGLYSDKAFTCCYIDDRVSGIPSPFKFGSGWYDIKYISGSFYPYVINIPEPEFVKNWQQRTKFTSLKEFNDYFSGKLNVART